MLRTRTAHIGARLPIKLVELVDQATRPGGRLRERGIRDRTGAIEAGLRKLLAEA